MVMGNMSAARRIPIPLTADDRHLAGTKSFSARTIDLRAVEHQTHPDGQLVDSEGLRDQGHARIEDSIRLLNPMWSDAPRRSRHITQAFCMKS